jgi:hypothetical protein
MVAETWRVHGDLGEGTWYSNKTKFHERPLIQLVEGLLAQAGVKKWPSAHTIHRARVEMGKRLATERASK